MAARIKRAASEGANLDSLMDALTNVVAVLIFVLLLVNCEVSQKLVKMMENIVPVSEEEVQKLKDMLKSIELEEAELEELKKQKPPSQVMIDDLKTQISNLHSLIKDRRAKIDLNTKTIAELQKLHDSALAARDAEKKETDAMMAEIERLEGLLDTTPVPKDIPATEITIPATRSIPEDAVKHYAFVGENRIHVSLLSQILEKIQEELEKKGKDMVVALTPEEEEKIKKEKRENRAKGIRNQEQPVVYDKAKMFEFLNKIDYKLPEGHLIEFQSPPWSPWVRYVYRWDYKRGGTTLDQLEQPSSNLFTNYLSRLRPPKDVVLFRVFPDSMLTYARARDMAEKRQLACGWEVMDQEMPNEPVPRFQSILLDFLPGIAVKPTGPAPAQDPNYKPPESARQTDQKLD
jgi:RNAse (barnase) inhibitor barstar